MAVHDIIGKHFGKLEVIKHDHTRTVLHVPQDGSKPYNINTEYYLCKCECGNTCVKVYRDLLKYPDISCGCGRIKETYDGVRIGMLVGTGRRERRGKPVSSTKPPAYHWEFRCDCGNLVWKSHKQIKNYQNNMHQDLPANCGCMDHEHTSIIRSRNHGDAGHGLSKTRLYTAWSSMKWRCSEKATGVYYRQYYMRGIRVCPEWDDPNDSAGSFKRFYDWAMANGYRDDLSIDRKENDGPYAPWNCRWVPMSVQARNKSTNKHFRYKDKIYTYADLGVEFGLHNKIIAAWKFRGYPASLVMHNLLHPDDKLQIRSDGRIVDEHGFQRMLPKYDAEYLD